MPWPAQACLDIHPPLYTSHVARMADACPHAQLSLVEMGSGELFAQVGLELRSFQSLPPK
jgi:hypothetical protein